MAKDTKTAKAATATKAEDTAKTNAKVKAKPKAAAKKPKPAKDVLKNVDGVVDVVILDDGLFDILYDEALLEEAAIIAALEADGYDVELLDCGC